MSDPLVFDARETNEIHFALLYARNFKHGTDGHNRLLLVAKLAGALGIGLDDEEASVSLDRSSPIRIGMPADMYTEVRRTGGEQT